ncbi:MAG: acyl-CoA dehydrogenase C-terminal domain-containing protein, partial [Sphingomonadaceae bacterium]|nr:acyl-CoA dehydrogenase C-terminal domain-containing protein [Sphingomonadaceae bacterium]
KLPLSGGGAVAAYIGELRGDVEALRNSNAEGFGRAADKVSAALDDLRAATDHLLAALGDGRTGEALAGATPYLRLFSLAAGGAYLIRGALAGEDKARVALARFFAENLIDETAALRNRVIEGADSLDAAAAALAL